MSKSAAVLAQEEEDERLNPKIAASAFDLLLIELVPLTYRILAELHARDAALIAASSHHRASRKTNTSNTGIKGVGETKTLPDRTSVVSGASAATGTAGTESTITATATAGGLTSGVGGTAGGAGSTVEEEETREAAFFRLDRLGYRVGQGLVERFSTDQPRPTTQLDSIKFVCKDLWTRVFRKQIDNLKTNHRGTFVLTDTRFQPLSRMSADRGAGPRGVDEALSRAQAFLWFPCGVIRGALSGLGMNVTVRAETTELPIATFQIQAVGAKA